jgi:hypothetical protein
VNSKKLVLVLMVAALAWLVSGLAAAQEQPRFTVMGVVIRAEGEAWAWIGEPTHTQNKLVRVRQGDRVGPYRVAKIAEDRVELTGTSGVVVVRISASAPDAPAQASGGVTAGAQPQPPGGVAGAQPQPPGGVAGAQPQPPEGVASAQPQPPGGVAGAPPQARGGTGSYAPAPSGPVAPAPSLRPSPSAPSAPSAPASSAGSSPTAASETRKQPIAIEGAPPAKNLEEIRAYVDSLKAQQPQSRGFEMLQGK